MARISLLCLLLLAGPCPAQEISLPKEVRGDPATFVVVLPEKVDADAVRWIPGEGLSLLPPELLRSDRQAVVMAARPGKYLLRAIAAKAVDGKALLSPLATTTVVIGTPPDPGPGPGPNPPVPPDPGPGPTPVAGLHVLILYESETVQTLPVAQQAILFNKDIREWLDGVTPLVGKQHTWRIWDKDVDARAETAAWRGLMQGATAKKVPWLIIGDGAGKVIHEEALPADVMAAKVVIQKYVRQARGK